MNQKLKWVSILLSLVSFNAFANNLIAVGNDTDNNITKPLILLSKDNGLSWSANQTITGLPTSSSLSLSNVSCYLNNCSATGTGNHLMLDSTDGGMTWSNNSIISNLPQDFNRYDNGSVNVQCTEKSCVGVGRYMGTKAYAPMLITKKLNDSTWSFANHIQSPTDLYNLIEFSLLTCKDDLCVAAGTYLKNEDSGTIPVIFKSTDNGVTWTQPKKIFLPVKTVDDYTFYNIDCLTSNYCALAGNYYDKHFNSHAILLITSDKGETWNRVLKVENANIGDGKLEGIHDITLNQDLSFATGTSYANHTYSPVIMTSKDQGRSWEYNTNIANFPGDKTSTMHSIDAIRCHENICVAGTSALADKESDLNPGIVVSYDHGKTWSYNTNIQGLPNGLESFAVSATYSDGRWILVGNTSNDVTYSGSVFTFHQFSPIMITSDDDGKTWSVLQNISGIPANHPFVELYGYTQSTTNVAKLTSLAKQRQLKIQLKLK